MPRASWRFSWPYQMPIKPQEIRRISVNFQQTWCGCVSKLATFTIQKSKKSKWMVSDQKWPICDSKDLTVNADMSNTCWWDLQCCLRLLTFCWSVQSACGIKAQLDRSYSIVPGQNRVLKANFPMVSGWNPGVCWNLQRLGPVGTAAAPLSATSPSGSGNSKKLELDLWPLGLV